MLSRDINDALVRLHQRIQFERRHDRMLERDDQLAGQIEALADLRPSQPRSTLSANPTI